MAYHRPRRPLGSVPLRNAVRWSCAYSSHVGRSNATRRPRYPGAASHRPSSMPVLPTTIDPNSEAFRANRRALEEAVAGVNEQLAAARAGGGERYVARHKERGKLLARERVELLIDRNSAFLELG